jgi:hypothetical protein
MLGKAALVFHVPFCLMLTMFIERQVEEREDKKPSLFENLKPI